MCIGADERINILIKGSTYCENSSLTRVQDSSEIAASRPMKVSLLFIKVCLCFFDKKYLC